MRWDWIGLFQTLIGTVKSRCSCPSQNPPALRVSNPHRYGQKLVNGYQAPHVPQFQTLIGTVKRRIAEAVGVRDGRRFQTLIGTVKSAPSTPPTISRTRFQTLIGTVKSILPPPAVCAGWRFQTLIGTVKSVVRWLEQAIEAAFQTLIGTVKSLFTGNFFSRGRRVSNPHRYGQKAVGSGYGWPGVFVSNPHRYGQKSHPPHVALIFYLVSNPHRYGQKPDELVRLGPVGPGFKPS